MKFWHRFKAWLVLRKIRVQHRELAKYIRRSAYEINAWKQDIGFLEETLAFHQAHSGTTSVDAPADGKVIPMESAEPERPVLLPAAHMA